MSADLDRFRAALRFLQADAARLSRSLAGIATRHGSTLSPSEQADLHAAVDLIRATCPSPTIGRVQ